MPIKNDVTKPRFLRKPPAPSAPSTTTPTSASPPAYRGESSTQGLQGDVNVAAKHALGFADVKVDAPKTAGARSALHGLSFLQRVSKKMKQGVLAAAIGLQLAVGANPTLIGNVYSPHIHGQHVLDIAAKNASAPRGPGPRALPDAQIVLDKWETLAATNPSFVIDGARATELILKAALPAQPAPNEDIASFAQKNLGADTQKLIAGVLTQPRMKLNDDAKALFAAVAVATLDGSGGVTVSERGGTITVKGAPGASIEVINLSTIPTKRLHNDDTFVLGTIGADGTFSGTMDMQGGDVIRLRLKTADGTPTPWTDFKASGADTRQAEVALFRVGLVDQGNGTIAVSNINSSRPVSEPGAVIRFVNTRSNESTDVTFNNVGSFPDGTTLPGKTGDVFSIRVSDGVNDAGLATEVSTLTVREAGKPSNNSSFHLPSPTLHHDEMDNGKPKFSLERFTGPLFDASGAEYTDVTQGQLGDCYFPASIATIAFHNKGTFEKIMQQKIETDPITGEDKVWYEVHFKDSAGKDVVQKVDGDLYVRSWGGPLYGSDDGVRSPEQMELWFSILEKAYAQWKGASYEAIGNGGSMDNVFRDILGVKATSMGIYDADATWKQIVQSVDQHRAIGAGTHGDDQAALYANSGVYADHAYSILGYKTDNGVSYVQVRNPWGESEPFPGDGKNDGIFFVKLSDFMKLYQTLYYATTDPRP